MRIRFLCMTAIAALGVSTASAGGISVTTSNSLVDFQNDVTGPIELVDFNGLGSDTSFSPTPVDLGPFTIGPGVGGLTPTFSPNFNAIDVSPFGAQNARFNIDGTAHARVFLAPFEAVTLSFDTPIVAFAADFRDLNSNGLTTQILLDTHAEQPGAEVNDDPVFIGYVSDTPFNEVTFRSPAANAFAGFSFDNVRFVEAAEVSEPQSVLLFGMGMLGLAAGLRRRSK